MSYFYLMISIFFIMCGGTENSLIVSNKTVDSLTQLKNNLNIVKIDTIEILKTVDSASCIYDSNKVYRDGITFFIKKNRPVNYNLDKMVFNGLKNCNFKAIIYVKDSTGNIDSNIVVLGKIDSLGNMCKDTIIKKYSDTLVNSMKDSILYLVGYEIGLLSPKITLSNESYYIKLSLNDSSNFSIKNVSIKSCKWLIQYPVNGVNQDSIHWNELINDTIYGVWSSNKVLKLENGEYTLYESHYEIIDSSFIKENNLNVDSLYQLVTDSLKNIYKFQKTL